MTHRKMRQRDLEVMRGNADDNLAMPWGSASILRLLDHIAVLEAEVRTARDAALEEALHAAASAPYDYDPSVCRRRALDAIRALKANPAPVVSVERVRDVLVQERRPYVGTDDDAGRCAFKVLTNAARHLGLSLDAEPQGACEGAPDCGWHNGGPCQPCKERATVENGLLPAPRMSDRHGKVKP